MLVGFIGNLRRNDLSQKVLKQKKQLLLNFNPHLEMLGLVNMIKNTMCGPRRTESVFKSLLV